jgi:hypothetical protein
MVGSDVIGADFHELLLVIGFVVRRARRCSSS